MADNNEFKVVFGADVSEAIAKIGQLTAAVQNLSSSMQGSMSQMSTNTTRSLTSFSNAIGNVGNKLTATITAPLVGLGVASLKTAAEMEQISVSFEVFTGSADVAKDTLKQLKDLALKSPMQFQDIARGTQTLLGYGLTAEQAVYVTKMLGDVSGGSSDKFQRLSLAFGQVQAAGKLMGQEARQMINAGFNPLQAISDKTGKSMAVLTKEMKNGQISVQDVADAFEAATSKGGRYYGMLDKQSQTLQGQFNKLKESVTFALAEIGDSLNAELGVGVGLQKLGAFIGELKDRFVELTPEAKEFNIKMVMIAIAIPPLLIGLSKIISLVNSLKTSFTALSFSGGGIAKVVLSLAASYGAARLATAAYNNVMEDAIQKDPTLLKEKNKELRQQIDHYNELLKIAKENQFVKVDPKDPFSEVVKPRADLIKDRNALAIEYNKNLVTIARLEKELAAGAGLPKPKFNENPPGEENKEFEKAARERQRLHDKWVADEAEYYGKLRTLDEANKLAAMRARDWWSTNYTEELQDLKAHFTGKIDEAKRYGAEYYGFEAELASKIVKLNQKVRESLATNRDKARKAMSDQVDARTKQDMMAAPQTAKQATEQAFADDSFSAMANYGKAFYAATKDFNNNLITGFAEVAATALAGGDSMKDVFYGLGAMIMEALGDYLIKIGTAAVAAGTVGTILKTFFTAGAAVVPELGIAGGMAAIAVGSALKVMAGKTTAAMDKNNPKNAASGTSSQASSMSSKASGSSYQYGGASYATQSVRLFVDLTGSITQTSTGYAINKSMETTLRITGR